MRPQTATTRKAATDMVTDVMATFLSLLSIRSMESAGAGADDIRR